MFTVEFGKIYRIFLVSSVSELFGNSSRKKFVRVLIQELRSGIVTTKPLVVTTGSPVLFSKGRLNAFFSYPL